MAVLRKRSCFFSVSYEIVRQTLNVALRHYIKTFSSLILTAPFLYTGPYTCRLLYKFWSLCPSPRSLSHCLLHSAQTPSALVLFSHFLNILTPVYYASPPGHPSTFFSTHIILYVLGLASTHPSLPSFPDPSFLCSPLTKRSYRPSPKASLSFPVSRGFYEWFVL